MFPGTRVEDKVKCVCNLIIENYSSLAYIILLLTRLYVVHMFYYVHYIRQNWIGNI